MLEKLSSFNMPTNTHTGTFTAVRVLACALFLAAAASLSGCAAAGVEPPCEFTCAGHVVLSISANLPPVSGEADSSPRPLCTALPAAPKTWQSYTLRCASLSGGESSLFTGLAAPVCDLAPGLYDLTLTANTSLGPAARGEAASVNVCAGRTLFVNVNISPLPLTDPCSAPGLLVYTILPPPPPSTCVPSLERAERVTETLLADGSEHTLSLDPGVYTLRVTMGEGGVERAAFDTVHIYSGLETRETVDMEAFRFSDLVYITGPASLVCPPEFHALSCTLAVYSDAAFTLPLGSVSLPADLPVMYPWTVAVNAKEAVGKRVYARLAVNDGLVTHTMSLSGKKVTDLGLHGVNLSCTIEKVSTLDLSRLVRRPAAGEAPVTEMPPQYAYTGVVAWEGEGGAPLAPGEVFGAKPYAALVTLTCRPHYTFAGLAADSFSHQNALSVTASFPKQAQAVIRLDFPAHM